jgi:hypothetical protein
MRRSRVRLESTVALCGCSCHAGCALAGRRPVPLTVWQQLCACPGAEFQRSWKEDPDEPFPGAREAWEQSQREWQQQREARQQAFRAARAAAAGKSREQVRDLYVSELRARGQQVPPEPLLGAEIDLLTGHRLRGLGTVWKVVRNPFGDR